MNGSILMKFATPHKSPDQFFWLLLLACIVVPTWNFSAFAADQSGLAPMSAFGPPSQAEHPDAIFIEALINESFFDLALETAEARQQLAAPGSNAAVQWTLLWIQAQAAKIAASPEILDTPDSADRMLGPIDAKAKTFQDLPRLPWIQRQAIWARWFVLRRLLVAYLAVPARQQIREWSLNAIRKSLDAAERLQEEIQKVAPKATRGVDKDISVEQWTGLINDTYLLQADLLLLRCQYYPAESKERVAAATEILTLLDKAKQRIHGDWSGRVGLDLARCTGLIYLNRASEALAELKSLQSRLETPQAGERLPTNRWRSKIAVLAAQACRSLGKLEEADDWIERAGGWKSSPELAIEYFANRVAPASGATNDTQLKAAMAIKVDIGNRFGTYWQQRAEAILVSNDLFKGPSPTEVSLPPTGIKTDLLMTEAKQLMTAKQWSKAIDKLSQAEQSAASSGNTTAAIHIAKSMASAYMVSGDRETSESEFHRAAMAYPKEKEAPELAIMSVWGFNRIVHASDTKSMSPEDEAWLIRQQIYRGRLIDIVKTWPTSPQAEQALERLERLLLATDKTADLLELWKDRIELLHEPPIASAELRAQALDVALSRLGLVRLLMQEAWLDTQPEAVRVHRELQDKWDGLQAVLKPLGEPSDRLAMEHALKVLEQASGWPAAELWIAPTQVRDTPADTLRPAFLLVRLASGQECNWETMDERLKASGADEVTRLSLQWTLCEIAYQRLLQTASNPNAIQCLKAGTAGMERWKELKDKDPRRCLSPLAQQRWERSMVSYRAAILCWGGNEKEGVAILSKALAAEPKSSWWLYRTARVYQALPNERSQALKQYRVIADGYPASSEAWWHARARTSQTLHQLGKTKAASDLAGLVFASYPEGETLWRPRFENRP